MVFYFKNTKKDIILIKEDEEDYRNANICRFCEKETIIGEVRDHCLLTGRYRGPAQNNCNFNVTQNLSIFTPFPFHNFTNFGCHMFFKELVYRKNDEVKFDIIARTNEEHISVLYGCVRFIEIYQGT